jgi:hypothetical protein
VSCDHVLDLLSQLLLGIEILLPRIWPLRALRCREDIKGICPVERLQFVPSDWNRHGANGTCTCRPRADGRAGVHLHPADKTCQILDP